MTKKELIEVMARGAGITKKQAEKALACQIEEFKNQLAEDRTVRLPGFGGFSMKIRPARTGRNPQTGERIQIPEKKAIRFSASPHILRNLN